LNASNNAESVHESGLQGLVIDTNDQGQTNFALMVGALGNASGTPLDGSQDISFGESAVGREFTVDRDEDNRELSALGHDPNDLDVIMMLATRRPVTDPRPPLSMRRSPTSTVQFNETVTEYPPDTMFTFGAASSTSTANVGGAETASPTQGDPQSSQSGVDVSTGGNLNSNDSNGNDGNQGGTSDGNDPQGPDPGMNYLDKLVFSCLVRGGQLSTWGISGRIRVADVVQVVGPESGMLIESIRRFLRPDLVDWVTVNTHFVYAHNEVQWIRVIINAMSLFMLKAPTLVQTSQHASGN